MFRSQSSKSNSRRSIPREVPNVNQEHDIESLSHRSPGEDEEDPYAEVDIDELPEWWRKGIEEHRAYGLRPYRPPRFEDDTIYPPHKQELEERFGIDLTLICYDIEKNVWDILIDGEPVGEVKRIRSPEGYSVIGMTSDEFESHIESEM